MTAARLRRSRVKLVTCPNESNHTPHPAGHVEHFDWAGKMMKTHTQERCPECGLWAIWIPKDRTA